ncbi:Phosphatidylinositol 3,4,5-trisphosphate 3-phosphatase and dual-specificity protein phosphatase PTEN [Golovinomyces cichoracearum]|uniref:phosphatidylinositol-3,4,5-trisphosphate 3-phosphatase n=1 Tax=Golovinomyces cichoracearum TaxID=62708 RepID=A0A420HAY7_9PEZI|nr:Phosphatidylinositol 3,4,5-trisphosphate 3-phosphatase and dual-specificity protein phosphatase PTEN [Golovinomyces cichoracearum]
MAFILRQIISSPRLRHTEADLDLCYVTSQIIATSGPSDRYPRRAYRNPLDQFVKFLDRNHGSSWSIWEFRAEGTGYSDKDVYGRVNHHPWPDHHPPPFKLVPVIIAGMRNWLHGEADELEAKRKEKRVVVVHCKAGKGRSGTMACSYLISECGWKPEEALAKFTEQRMRPGFGQGVSIPSQLRWVGYVDRWTKCDKKYLDRQIEITEICVWGLRKGVKVQVQGFIDEGKTIKNFHIFSKIEQKIIMKSKLNQTDSESSTEGNKIHSRDNTPASNIKAELSVIALNSPDLDISTSAVIFKPSSPIILPTSDVNIDFERRTKPSFGWKLVTSLAHVWFNCYFEGQGPEQDGKPNDSGIFKISWDQMDGIKGSSKKGTKALDRLAVVWRAHNPDPQKNQTEKEANSQPNVPEKAEIDTHVDGNIESNDERDLGLRPKSPPQDHPEES